jgi:Uma2 family endonuclease
VNGRRDYNTDMSTATLVPVSEYLGTTYHPDLEYIEGVLKERNVGEMSHGEAQTMLAAYVLYKLRGFWAVVEVRAQIKADRFRIPDVTIVRGGKPLGRMFTEPPEVAVEVLSPDDRIADIQEKIDDYLAFGVPCVWVINPENRRAWIHTKDGAREAKDGVLRNPAGDIEIPLSAIFAE